MADIPDERDIYINDKGQLRLSHRALLPETNSEKLSPKQRTNSLTKENVAPQKASDKGTPKKLLNVPKDSLAKEATEQPKDSGSPPDFIGPSGGDSVENNLLSQEKVIKKFVSSARDHTDKDRPKKSSSKAVSSVSSEEGSNVVNGGA